MRTQDTLPSEVTYTKQLIKDVKAPQVVASSNAVFYLDTRADGQVTRTPTLAAGATINYLCTYTHPEASYPFARLQYGFSNVDQAIFYELYKYTLDLNVPTQTSWVLSLRNGSGVSDTFDIAFGVVSNASGTLGVTTI